MLVHAVHGTRADVIAQGILIGCFVVFLVFWAAMALWTKRTVERSGWSWRLISVLLAVAAFEITRHGGRIGVLAGQTLWGRGIVIDVVADVLAITGLALMLWARVTLGSNWSGSVVFKENHELVTRGPYAFVRHPIYTGLLTMLLGGVIFFGLVGGIVWLVVAFVLFWLKSRAEESLMTRHFPAEYAAYRGRVKALVPFVFCLAAGLLLAILAGCASHGAGLRSETSGGPPDTLAVIPFGTSGEKDVLVRAAICDALTSGTRSYSVAFQPPAETDERLRAASWTPQWRVQSSAYFYGLHHVETDSSASLARLTGARFVMIGVVSTYSTTFTSGYQAVDLDVAIYDCRSGVRIWDYRDEGFLNALSSPEALRERVGERLAKRLPFKK